MTPEAFAYWLKGALELNPEMLEKGMTPEQTQTMKDHLDLVFDKVTPDRFGDKFKIDTPEVVKNILKHDEEEITFHPFPGSPGGQLYCGKQGSREDGMDTLLCNNLETDLTSTIDDSEEEEEKLKVPINLIC